MPTSNTIHQRKNLRFSITTTCDSDHSCEVNEVFSQDHVEYRVGTMTKVTPGFINSTMSITFLLQDVVLTFTATLTKLFSKFYQWTGF